MTKDPAVAIRDCLAKIDILHRIAGATSLTAFRNDPIVRCAAAHAIQAISAAIRHLPDDWLADYPTQPWRQIKSIGDRIRHQHFRPDDDLLWEMMTMDSHALKDVMVAMLERHTNVRKDD